MDGVGEAAAVAQLVAYVVKLILAIVGLAETARRNKRECKELAARVSVIRQALPSLKQQDPGVAEHLAGLRDALQEALDLVSSACCQKRRRKRDIMFGLLGADRQAQRFREVNGSIDRHLNLIPLLGHISITSRLEEIMAATATLLLPPSGSRPSTVASAGGGGPADESSDHGLPRKLTWAEITAATGGWAAVVGRGRGSSSTVYKGRLRAREVAVKRLEKHGRRAMDDAFVAEFEVLYPLRHGHVVRLVGWCAEGDGRRAFVYDHAANGTLRAHLQSGSSSSSPVTATWRARVEALLGAARAIDHLHRGARGVVHRDVSSSSILLDARWAARLAGFGAAVFRAPTGGGGGDERQDVSEVVGAHGYLDPEYLRTGRVGPASDVYSFGVVIMEALTGKPPVEAITMKSQVMDGHWKLRRGALDGRPEPEKEEALELVAYTAERCLWPNAEHRPPMSDVVANLDKALGMMTRR